MALRVRYVYVYVCTGNSNVQPAMSYASCDHNGNAPLPGPLPSPTQKVPPGRSPSCSKQKAQNLINGPICTSLAFHFMLHALVQFLQSTSVTLTA